VLGIIILKGKVFFLTIMKGKKERGEASNRRMTIEICLGKGKQHFEKNHFLEGGEKGGIE